MCNIYILNLGTHLHPSIGIVILFLYSLSSPPSVMVADMAVKAQTTPEESRAGVTKKCGRWTWPGVSGPPNSTLESKDPFSILPPPNDPMLEGTICSSSFSSLRVDVSLCQGCLQVYTDNLQF